MKRIGTMLLLGIALGCQSLSHAAEVDAPQYAANGDLIPPQNYREWIFLSSGLGMNYSEPPPGAAPAGIFGNVFVNPSAYKAFMASGAWPEGAQFVLELRAASGKGSITKAGKFQADVTGMEMHVKDQGRWSFYAIRGGAPAARIGNGALCYTCHGQHGAVDTTFVQFYPTLISVAQNKGTYHEAALSAPPSDGGTQVGKAAAETETALRAALAAIAQGQPPYSTMTADAGEILRGALAQSAAGKLGAVQSISYTGLVEPAQAVIYQGEPQKLAQFEVQYATGSSAVWRIFVQSDGVIGRLVPFRITAK